VKRDFTLSLAYFVYFIYGVLLSFYDYLLDEIALAAQAISLILTRLLSCVHIVGQRFKQFYCRQLKNEQLDKMSAKVLEM